MTRPAPDPEDIAARVRAFIQSSESAPRTFHRLFREIARSQGLLVREGQRETLRPIPETAFKTRLVARFDPAKAEAEFWSSGTTTGTPARHLVLDLSLYRLSVLQGFRRFVLYEPRPRTFLRLIPDSIVRPHSSLSRMVDFVVEAFADTPPPPIRQGAQLDLDAFRGACARARERNLPVCLLGTTLDLLTLLSGLDRRPVALPPGSRVLHTGGAKATGRVVDRNALIRDLGDLLGIPPADVIEEYGMTELMSQAYDAPRVTPGPRRFVPVPWMRTRVVHPTTGRLVPSGRVGMLVHWDLANLHSAVAIWTGDMARRIADGFGEVHRASGAVPRGCSAEAAVSVLPGTPLAPPGEP